MSQLTQPRSRGEIGALQIAIVVCAVMAAFIHLYASVQPGEDLGFWFFLNGAGYLGLLTIFFMPRFAAWHDKISFLLMGYALLTIVLWFIFGQAYDLVGYAANSVEIVLAVLALYEGCRSRRLRQNFSGASTQNKYEQS
jgi:hypothetical protein